METQIQAQEDFLIPNLSLQTRPGAKYVLKRRNATVHSAIATASPTGVSTIKYALSSDTEWLDPSSIVVSFNVNNLDGAKALAPASIGAHILFSRLQVRVGGILAEDIDFYAQVCEMFERAIPVEKRINFGGLGFGQTMAGNLFLGGNHSTTVNHIPANTSRRVFMRLALSGLANCQRWIPLPFIKGGVELYLTLHQPSDCLNLGTGGTQYSQDFNLTDLRLECDMMTLDSDLDASYARMIQAGNALHLHFKSWNMTQQYIAAGNGGQFDLSLSKSYSRLANVFAIFGRDFTAAEKAAGTLPINTSAMFPQARETIESYLTLGSKRAPDFPNRGLTEHYWRLMTALGVALSLPHSINISYDDFALNSFIYAAELEKVPMVYSSGENTTGGQELGIHIKGFQGATATDIPRNAVICLHVEKLLSLTAGGVLLEE